MKKNNEIRIKCSTEEKDKIRKQSDKAGLTLQEYILRLALNTEVEIKIISRE